MTLEEIMTCLAKDGDGCFHVEGYEFQVCRYFGKEPEKWIASYEGRTADGSTPQDAIKNLFMK